jgi:hypothetical protein
VSRPEPRLLYVTDRAVQARVRARRVRTMSERLAAAIVRAEEQQAKRQAAERPVRS